MAFPTRKIYEFGDFRLDPAENLLLKGDSPVPLKPKEFSILVSLVQNHGSLVQRSTLLSEIWGDSFVEEAVVSKCIWSIRNALGDDSKTQAIIQTVPKRGYRFILDVTELVHAASEETHISGVKDSTITLKDLPDAAINGETNGDSGSHKPFVRRFAVLTLIIMMAAFGAISIGSYYGLTETASASILSRPFNLRQLSADGRVHHAVLSPDGNMAYYVRGLGQRQSIRARDLNGGHESELIPAAKIEYAGVSISPDGKTLFFTRGYIGRKPLELFRVPVTGGIPQKIADDVQGWTSVSPEGSSISFVRCRFQKDDYCSLYVADSASGKNESKIVTRAVRFRIGASAFTPDGKSIIFANGQSHTAANEFRLDKVDIATGVETEVTSERFFNIKHLAWIEGSGYLLITAIRSPAKRAGLWKVDVRSGEVEEINVGQNHLNVLSLDSTASVGIATTVSEDFQVEVYDIKDGDTLSILGGGHDAGFVPDGRVVFSSDMSGQSDLWSSGSDGSGLRQLTNDSARDFSPVVSDDGDFIYYSSNRGGDLQLWRINIDGTHPIQITKRIGGYPIGVSNEAGRVFYISHLDRMIWAASLDGSWEEVPLVRIDTLIASISSDGKLLAYVEKTAGMNARIVVKTIDGQDHQSSVIDLSEGELAGICWSRDNRSFYYISNGGSRATIYKQDIFGGPSVAIREIPSPRYLKDQSFALSFDEKSMIVSSGDWKHDMALITGLR